MSGELEAPSLASMPILEKAVEQTLIKLFIGTFIGLVEGKLALRNTEERRAMIHLMKLGKIYFTEMCQCCEANAKLSSIVMACSGLETLLILACLCYKNEVITTRVWSKVSKKVKGKSFVQTLQDRSVGIATLIEIAECLGWFSPETPSEFTESVSPQEMESFLALIPIGETASSVAPRFAKDVRNLLHPGVCLRTGRDIESDESLLAGMASMGLALACFAMRQGTEKSCVTVVEN
jgi:hypothetical protein